MVIKRTIDKETVKDLPKAAFPGQIHVVQTPWEAEKAVAYLKSCPLLGIDSENPSIVHKKDRYTRWPCCRFPQRNIAFCSAST